MSQDCGPQPSNAEATPGVRPGPHRQRPTQSAVHTSRLKQAAPLPERSDKLLNAATSTEVLGILHRRRDSYRTVFWFRPGEEPQVGLHNVHNSTWVSIKREEPGMSGLGRACAWRSMFFFFAGGCVVLMCTCAPWRRGPGEEGGIYGPVWSLLVRVTVWSSRLCRLTTHTSKFSGSLQEPQEPPLSKLWTAFNDE